MATNALGHQLASGVGDVTTLGAYRRGYRLPWVPGATIDAWVPCARGEIATGVPQPHVYYVQTIGGGAEAQSGSIYCPSCRAEVAERRRSGVPAVPLSAGAAAPRAAAGSTDVPPLPSLPF